MSEGVKKKTKIKYGALYLMLTHCITATLGQQIPVRNLSVGDTVPDVLIAKVSNHKTTEATLSDFGSKLLIIDFWATWCQPCIGMIPRMDSLQKAHAGEVQFLSVTYQDEGISLPFLERYERLKQRKYDIPVISGDTVLSRLFPHQTVPHYVWIDQESRTVAAITGLNEINGENIQQFLGSKKMNLAVKKDELINYQYKDPLLIYLVHDEQNRVREHFLEYAYFTDYIPGFSSGMNTHRNDPDTTATLRLTIRNLWPLEYFRRAFGQGSRFLQNTSIAMEVQHPEKLTTTLSGPEFKEWLRDNSFCYELVMPRSKQREFPERFKTDVLNFFSAYEVKVEKRKVPCLVLVSIGGNDLLKTKGGKTKNDISPLGVSFRNYTMHALIVSLSHKYLKDAPVLVDESGIDFNIDMDIELLQFTDIDVLNDKIKKYGLRFVHEDREVDILVIKDK